MMPLPGVPLSAWLCLVALTVTLPFLLAGIDHLMINIVPVSLGLLLGLAGMLVGSRVYPVLNGDHKRVAIQALFLPLRAALRHGLQTARFDSASRGTARAPTVTGYLRQAGEWLARLQHHTEYARRPLTGALWLGIAGGLMGAFVIAT